jgi:hypothetical protein
MMEPKPSALAKGTAATAAAKKTREFVSQEECSMALG